MGAIITAILGEDIGDGSLGYVDPADGNMYKADNSDASKQATCYIVLGGNEGEYVQGHLDGYVNTSLEAYIGQAVYLSNTPGLPTIIPPASPQRIGTILPGSKIALSIAQKQSNSTGGISLAASFFKL